MKSSNWSSWQPNMMNTRAQLDAFLPGKSEEFQTNETRYSEDNSTLGSEVAMKSILQQEQEVRALQKALNLPQAPVLPSSLMSRPAEMPSFNALLSSSTRQTRIVTETDLRTKTDSLYMSNMMMENPSYNSLNHTEQSYLDFHTTLNRVGAPLSASSSAQVQRGANNTALGSQRKYHFKENYSHPSKEESFLRPSELNDNLWNPQKTAIGGCCEGLYDTKTRDCFTESCNGTQKSSLLDKVKEAQLVIEHQSEVITRAEHEISSLQRELKKMALDKEMCEEEMNMLRQEREKVDGIKSEGTKKRQELLKRLNQLDQDFKELHRSHNALLMESKKKEADLLQAEVRLNALEDCNSNLQQVNDNLRSELKLAKQQTTQLLGDQKMLHTEKQQVQGETVTARQENNRLADENSILKTRCADLNRQLWEHKTSHGRLIQDLEELKMAYELKCNRVGLLEEEVKQQQETFDILYKEQEQSIKRNMEQIYLNKESLYLAKIRKLTENKDLLQRKFQDVLQMDKMAESTVLTRPGALNSDNTIDKQTVSNLKRQVDQLMIENSNLAVKVQEVDSLKDELSHSHAEQTRLLEQLESLHEDHTRALNENKDLQEQLDYSQSVQAELEKGVQDLSSSNEVLYSEVVNLKENEKKSQTITELQENLKQIKIKITSLEEEKCDLMLSLEELQQDRDSWSKEKKEMMLSLAELNAENNEMREQIKESSKQVSSEVISDDFQAIKQELDKVHKMLRLKDEELETQCSELHDKQNQLNRLNEENTHLKKSFADIASKTSARNLVISTLRDQVEEQGQRITELEHELTSKNQQFEELNTRHSKLEMELCQSTPKAMRWINDEKNRLEADRDLLKVKVLELKSRLNECVSKNVCTDEIILDSTNTELSIRRKSDGCLTRRIGSHGVLSKNEDRLHALKRQNSKLRVRVDDLLVERNSVLQDSEDLMEGMQQLKEAFEEELDRRLEKQK